jgi:hypothetical protein
LQQSCIVLKTFAALCVISALSAVLDLFVITTGTGSKPLFFSKAQKAF